MSELNFVDILENEDSLNPITDIINEVMQIKDEDITPEYLALITATTNSLFSEGARNKLIDSIINNFAKEGQSRTEVNQLLSDAVEGIDILINMQQPSKEKRQILETVFNNMRVIFDEVKEKYRSYDIELPMTVAEGGHEPTYAHETDAAADLYALETVTVPAHSLGNKIHTGLCIGLPEGWKAHIAPRSSIGAKTPLRLSNSLGVIDSGYRGEIMVLFDNISDSDYTINAGDRIAQMWVSPVYKFKGVITQTLDTTERNTGGFGSTGK